MSKEPVRITGQEGKIKIANDIIMTIAQHSAKEVEGIISIKGGVPRGMMELFENKNDIKKNIKLQDGDDPVIINLSVAVDYGVVIPQVVRKVQDNVKRAVEAMADIPVAKVNVFVQDVIIK